MTKENKELSFEEALERLEEIVEKMEEGDIPLEAALDYYSEGANLSKICHNKLTKAEKKMQQIVDENGELVAFDLQEEK
ncbi:exodeoxyribonuclease VII small subunit [Saliterribacillus persicus]|uniref:Exodeoxyribonuclease 7 small subunit n=1 Tax=Saliterribacillus persicus TaxID=930114 RepID=A0A368XBS4_9BACI|nr:exodeoxyribonuclease VII small subunit [Saliterribacillus persicus]RCW65413.1 exodeoxyribonuclease VII small subunit [Saliterribacillus persicus]